MKENETDWAYERREIPYIGALREKVKMRDHTEYLEVDGRIILMWVLQRLHEFVFLDEGRDQ